MFNQSRFNAVKLNNTQEEQITKLRQGN